VKSKLLFTLIAALSVATFAVSQAQQAAAGSDEQTLIGLEMQWLKADQTNNPDLAAPLMSDKYTALSVTGAIEDKAQALADFKTRKYTSADYEGGVKVVVSGSTAITRGTYLGAGTDSGKPFREHLRWTDTWVKSDGKWQCLATHYSKV
jgi:hypothetical protein